MPSSRTFPSKQAAAEHLRDMILTTLRGSLTASTIKIGVRDSPQTNSKYVYLYYPDRSDNPDTERVPYTVRISDHDQTYLFRRNRPNACFRIVPVLTDEQRQQREQKIALYEHLSLSLQTKACGSDAVGELVRLRDTIARNLQTEQNRFEYTYRGELTDTLRQMHAIIEQNIPLPLHG